MTTPQETERSLWLASDGWSVEIIDQTKLPHEVRIVRLRSVEDAARAIVTMQVRGAPLIGITAAYGMALALRADAFDQALRAADALLRKTRPTAVNLGWALDEVRARVQPLSPSERVSAAYARAAELAEEDVAANRAIGEHGLGLFRSLLSAKPAGEPLRILTHCNAGRLATVAWGTATAPMYLAHQSGLSIHVWVSETRPRNQGAALTAWELGKSGVPLTVIADNAAGHLIQRGLVDVVIVGADRATARGDVANKIGTYLKALAAHAHQVPFYVALPSTTIDWTIQDGITERKPTRSPGKRCAWRRRAT
jgi:methylthioribose-1-phosphate isomerase